jgi:hypothetical protein
MTQEDIDAATTDIVFGTQYVPFTQEFQYWAHKSSTKSSGPPKKETKKSVNDYNYYLRSAKQASNYEMTIE